MNPTAPYAPTRPLADRRRAFTFVELMLVMTMILILWAIAIPNFLEAKIRARVAKSKVDLAMLKAAIESYRLDARAYPPNVKAGEPGLRDLIALTTPIAYVPSVPIDVFLAGGSQIPAESPGPGIPYLYLNGAQANPGGGIIPDEPAYLPGQTIALAWGIGPTGQPAPRAGSAQPREHGTTVRPGGKVSLLAYDPTNGSTTPGDIYQRMP